MKRENKIHMKVIAFLLYTFCFFYTSAQQKKADVKEYTRFFTTYPFSDPNPIANMTNIYPYFRFDGFTHKPVQKEWKVVELENDFIRLMILPEIGGKIWSAEEKSTGKPFLYYNHVVKFRDIAMRGPWTSGGLEANFGIIGHTPNCATPVDYKVIENDNGSVSCFIGTLDLLTRTYWTMEINLEKDKAYFTTKTFWHNSGSFETPYYHWMNAGIKTAGGLQYIFPGNAYLGHDGDYHGWPVNKTNGKDISYYENNNFGGYKSYHVFGDYTDFFGAYWKDDDLGVVKYGEYADKPGKKIWIWGLSDQGMIWENLLTDNDGQYSEIQSGRLFNQTSANSTFTPFKHKGFEPYATDTWQEQWYPVLKTGGITTASRYGALNIERNGEWIKMYFSPTQTIKDSLKIYTDDHTLIYSKLLNGSPLEIFRDSIKLQNSTTDFTVRLGSDKLQFQSATGSNKLNRPVQSPANFDWNTAQGLYIQGSELMLQKNYKQAEEKLQDCLKKDANYLPALTEMASLQIHNIQHQEALKFTRKALSIDAYDARANFYYGIINAQLGNITDAKDGLSVAALSTEYRSAAYTELGKLALQEKNWANAINQANRALDYNRLNISALELMAIAYRLSGDAKKATETLELITQKNPLNHFAGFEKYLLQSNNLNKAGFQALIKNEMEIESYIELAMIYYKAGLFENALTALSLSKQNAITFYWSAYLLHLLNRPFTPQLREAANSSPAFIFPFREEDAAMLKWTIGQHDDWKPKYYLALLFNDRGLKDSCAELLNQCKNLPDFAPFYATRASIIQKENFAEADLKKAVAINNKEWRYYKLLTEFYIDQNKPAEALKTIEPFYKKEPDNYIIGILYAKVLLANQKYTACINVLNSIQILPFEGATAGRDLYKEANLMRAITEMENKNYAKAKVFINDARKWPENLGSGKPYVENIDERLEDWLIYLCSVRGNDNINAQQFLSKILLFGRSTSADAQIIEANHLITAWAIEQTENKQQALHYLQSLLNKNTESKVMPLVIAGFEKNIFKAKINIPELRVIETLIHSQK